MYMYIYPQKCVARDCPLENTNRFEEPSKIHFDSDAKMKLANEDSVETAADKIQQHKMFERHVPYRTISRTQNVHLKTTV